MKTFLKVVVPAAALLALAMISISFAKAEVRPAIAPKQVARSLRAEGRLVPLPGAQVTVGTEMAGTLVRLGAQEKQRVRKGEVLAELRADEQRAALAEAVAQRRIADAALLEIEAQVREAAAQLRQAELHLERSRTLAAQGNVPRETFDRALNDRDAAAARAETARARVQTAVARRSAAQATERRLRAVLDRARIAAPIDGVVLERHAEPGETVAANARLFTIADLDRARVEAEVDEFDAAAVSVGAEVAVSVEGHAGKSWRGRVEEIPDRVVPRRSKPEDPGRPSDTRVLLVKVALLERAPIKLGQRVEVAIAAPPPSER